MEKSSVFVVLAVLYTCVNLSRSSSCMITAPSQHPNNTCSYGRHVIAVGGAYTDYEHCVEYSCGESGRMWVCGIGINSYYGVIAPPPGCIQMRGEKCTFTYVDANDPTIKCQSEIIG